MPLNVLYNGHRLTVATSPSTSMHQVLEQAKSHFKVPRTNDWSLQQKNIRVDLSLPFRLTGLNNNTTLELICTKNNHTNIRVCIQQPNGKRSQGTFSNSMTLSQMLCENQLATSDDAAAVPSLVFMRREIPYEALSNTTLKGLGISEGSAMFRLQYQSRSAAVSSIEAAPSSTLSHEIQVKSSLPPPSPTTVDTNEQRNDIPIIATPVDANPQKKVSFSPSSASMDLEKNSTESIAKPVLDSAQSLLKLRDSCFDAVSRDCVLTLMKIVCNILSKPDNEKVRRIRLGNPTFHRNVGKVIGGIDFLMSVGFILDSDNENLVLPISASTESNKKLQHGLDLLDQEASDLLIDQSERPKVKTPAPADLTFNPYKSTITRTEVNQPRGPSTTERKVELLKKKQQQLLSNDIPARETQIFFRSENLKVPRIVDSNHTKDSALILSHMKQKQTENEKKMNFQTSAMRELDSLKKKKVFKETIIRIQFSDQAIFESKFHPNETLGDVETYLISCMNPDVKELIQQQQKLFYITPPKIVLDTGKQLSELGLVPAAVVYLTFPLCETNFSTPTLFEAKWFGKSLGSPTAVPKDDVTGNRMETSYPKAMDLVPKTNDQLEMKAPAKEVKKSITSSISKAKKPSWFKL